LTRRPELDRYFLGFSYGFRPGAQPDDALDALAVGMRQKKVNWVLDADVRGFFDAVDHGWLMKFLEHRIADKRVLRLTQKWLNAGTDRLGRGTSARQRRHPGRLQQRHVKPDPVPERRVST
jgi:RNA-directed DNA polymerase